METKQKIQKPAEFAEQKIVDNILSGVWKKGDNLPPERKLVEILGVTRQTVRETLKHLAAEGWITIQHGKPTKINDYIEDGSLATLKTLAKFPEFTPVKLIQDWLEFRMYILPKLAQKAVDRDLLRIKDFLKNMPSEKSKANELAKYDFELQLLIIKISGNAIVKMIYNDLQKSYLLYTSRYFDVKSNRIDSTKYYKKLLDAIENDTSKVKSVVQKAMRKSIKNYLKMTSID